MKGGVRSVKGGVMSVMSVLTQRESGSDRESSCHGHRVSAVVRQARDLTYSEPAIPNKERVERVEERGDVGIYLLWSLLL